MPALRPASNFIRLATPTTDDERLPAVLANTSGFVYYVSMTGITGAAAPDAGKVAGAVARIKRHTDLPVAVGFGVKTAEQAPRHRRRCRWRRRRHGDRRCGARRLDDDGKATAHGDGGDHAGQRPRNGVRGAKQRETAALRRPAWGRATTPSGVPA